jgi:hypothetical protein
VGLSDSPLEETGFELSVPSRERAALSRRQQGSNPVGETNQINTLNSRINRPYCSVRQKYGMDAPEHRRTTWTQEARLKPARGTCSRPRDSHHQRSNSDHKVQELVYGTRDAFASRFFCRRLAQIRSANN